MHCIFCLFAIYRTCASSIQHRTLHRTCIAACVCMCTMLGHVRSRMMRPTYLLICPPPNLRHSAKISWFPLARLSRLSTWDISVLPACSSSSYLSLLASIVNGLMGAPITDHQSHILAPDLARLDVIRVTPCLMTRHHSMGHKMGQDGPIHAEQSLKPPMSPP